MAASGDDDPDAYRMSFGQHLEELRIRVMLGLAGFIVAAIVCFIFGTDIVWIFCRPLMNALQRNHLTPLVYAARADEAFTIYIKISIISAAAIASPWLVYQLWQFVGKGLYPRERKAVTKYVPLSVTLLIAGMLFLYFVVLPLMLDLFIAFQIGPPMKFGTKVDTRPAATSQPVYTVPILQGDPPSPQPGQLWFDLSERRLKIFLEGESRVLPYESTNLVSSKLTLGEYVDMVLGLLLSFGLAFQLPLVVLAAARTGIVEIDTLRRWRRGMYFGAAVLAAFIVPDVVTGMIALWVPLLVLYEFGILLSVMSLRKQERLRAVER